MDEGYFQLQGSGSYTVTAELFGCLLCGVVVYDKDRHSRNAHPSPTPEVVVNNPNGS